MIPAFKSAAEELLNNSDLSVVDLFAKALAKAVVSQFSSSFFSIFFLAIILENTKSLFYFFMRFIM